jgi:hypothetical protein
MKKPFKELFESARKHRAYMEEGKELEAMTTYTDNQLKQALAKMLPEQLEWREWEDPTHPDNPVIATSCALCWDRGNPVLDTELLHICWLIEQSIPSSAFSTALMHVIQDETCWPAVESRYATASASWQQRTIALAKVKGVEIV